MKNTLGDLNNDLFAQLEKLRFWRLKMEKREAIQILQEHISTYKNQITDGGWERMVRAGIARDNIYEKLAFRADAEKQIQAYEMAIKALENSETEEWVDRCYLGSPCPYQNN